MAGLIGLTAADMEIQDALGATKWRYEGEWVPHPVVRFTTTLPIAVNAPDGRSIVRARWGFPIGGGRPVGNARDDRLTTSRLWSNMLAQSPCLFAATGIYEMKKDGDEKTSYWFRRTDGKPIVMPGLAKERSVKGERGLCAAIITTQPNEFFNAYHNRQVCTLSEQQADSWMSANNANDAMRVLHAPANDEWEAVPVDGRIFKPGRVEMEHLVAVGEPERFGGS